MLLILLGINGVLIGTWALINTIGLRKKNSIKKKLDEDKNIQAGYKTLFLSMDNLLTKNKTLDNKIDELEHHNKELESNLATTVSQSQFEAVEEKIMKASKKFDLKKAEKESLYKKAYPILQKIEDKKRKKREEEEELAKKKRKKRQEEEDSYRSSYASSSSSSSSSDYSSSSSSSSWSGGGGDSSGGGSSSSW